MLRNRKKKNCKKKGTLLTTEGDFALRWQIKR